MLEKKETKTHHSLYMQLLRVLSQNNKKIGEQRNSGGKRTNHRDSQQVMKAETNGLLRSTQWLLNCVCENCHVKFGTYRTV